MDEVGTVEWPGLEHAATMASAPKRVGGGRKARQLLQHQRTRRALGNGARRSGMELDQAQSKIPRMRTNDVFNAADVDSIASVTDVFEILDVIQSHPELVEAQKTAFVTLKNVTMGNAKNTSALISGEGLVILIKMMARYFNEEIIQEAGCRLLQNATMFNSECQARVAAVGGIQTILKAMGAHSSTVSVQEAGCHALKELAAYSTANQEAVMSAGGFQIVLRAMEVHSPSKIVQELGCGVLRNMTASNAQHQEEAVSRGAVPIVISAMQSHQEVSHVQSSGCWALFCLCVHNNQTREEVAAFGATRVALTAMETNRADPRVQEAGCWLVKEMVERVVDSDRSIFAACIQGVLKAMEKHADKSKVQTAARSALRQLAAHDSEGRVRAACLGRCGRMGRSVTMHALSVIPE